NVGEPRGSGRDQPIAEAQLTAQRHAVRLLDEQRVGSAVDGVAVNLLAENHAAGARSCLQQHEWMAAQMQFVSGRESGDAAADDDDRRHETVLTTAAVRGSGASR